MAAAGGFERQLWNKAQSQLRVIAASSGRFHEGAVKSLFGHERAFTRS